MPTYMDRPGSWEGGGDGFIEAASNAGWPKAAPDHAAARMMAPKTVLFISCPLLPPNDAGHIRCVQRKIPLNESRTSGVTSVMARCMIAWLLAAYCYGQDPQAAARALIPPGAKYSDAPLDSLGEEADSAIARIPRATTKTEVENARQPLRKSLERSLGLERLLNGSQRRTEYFFLSA